jgi:hypothetical protein
MYDARGRWLTKGRVGSREIAEANLREMDGWINLMG